VDNSYPSKKFMADNHDVVMLFRSVLEGLRDEMIADHPMKMNYPAAEQRGIYKNIVTPQAAEN